jgi:hypothetical protein
MNYDENYPYDWAAAKQAFQETQRPAGLRI